MSWMPAGWQAANPSTHCPSRGWTGGSLGAFSSPEVLNQLITNTNTYDDYRSQFEAGPHAQPHVAIGGDMGTMSSPNDPIFYAHHAFVDKMYYQWQQAKPSLANTFPLATDTQLEPYPQTIDQVFDISSLCYSYEDLTATQATATQSAAARLVRRSAQSASDDQDTDASPANATTSLPANPSYAPEDRGNLRALRYTSPLPSAWIEMQGFDETTVRSYESHNRDTVDQINAIAGYVSPAALCRRVDLVASLVGSVSNFYVDVAGKNPVALQYNAGDVNTTSKGAVAAGLVKQVAQLVPGLVTGGANARSQVVKIAGSWTGAKDSMSNFETAFSVGPPPAKTSSSQGTSTGAAASLARAMDVRVFLGVAAVVAGWVLC